ncbi:MAG: tetratricopeptide repeat protein [Bacteroidetes bacterium]|nr:tetratricopeptide repeat protein [Flavobacteriales bacterium]NOG96050.1 tetratricopeptide repeat protein [Bacteroidota bacterium]WKZ74015.1 MAG: tetratricopeptide repeat protein [Vicingaceae bacterium]
MKFKIALSIFFLFTTFCCVYSANENERRIDSLVQINKNIDEFKLLDSLSWQYRYTNIELAVAIANRLQKKIEAVKIDSSLIEYLVNISSIYRQNNEFGKAMRLLDFATIHAHRTNNLKLLWRIYNNKGNAYRNNNDLINALKTYFIGLKIAEYLKNEGAMASIYNNIGSIYFSTNRYKESLTFFLKAYKIYTNNSASNSFHIAAIADNIGMVYNELKQYDKALAFHLQAKKGFEKTEDLGAKSTNLTSISNVLINKKLFDEALVYIDKAIELSGNSNSISFVLANNTKSIILYELGRFKEAEELSKINIRYYDSINSTFGLHELYYDLTKNYIKQRNVDNALKYLSLYRHLNDSINSSEFKAELSTIEAKYAAEKKEQQIALLEKDKKNKQLIIYSTSGGLVLVFVLALIIFRSYREKRKSNITLVQQNNIIQSKNKDITDSINYAQRIQLAMQPSRKLIQEYFPNSFVFYQPKDIVSGDFFWFTKQENHIFIAAVDCTGHGVPGALMSMIGINFLNQLVIENKQTDTSVILNRLHNHVKNALRSNNEDEKRDSNDGMDIALVRIDPLNNKVQFSGAVRPFYYFENNILKSVKGDKYSIGGIKDETTPYTSHSFSFNSIQSFYIFSDGYADQFGGKANKKFMLKTFQELLISVQHKTVKEQEEEIKKSFNQWKGTNEQIDDILVIGVNLNP